MSLYVYDTVKFESQLSIKTVKNRVKQGQLCLHMPSTEFAHAQLRVNMVALYTKPSFLG